MNKNLNELFEFLAIPTISAQKEHKGDMAKACDWLKNKLQKMKFKVRVMTTGGHPVVYAQNLSAGKNKPTVLIYGHYDVQSPDPLKEWKSDPFKPEVRNGNIYGRGTADDKGQLYTWIAALEEILAKNRKVPANIKFLIEGEEEVGSVNIDRFIMKNLKLLKADICVISDSHCLSETIPLICYGVRGLVYVELKIKTMPKDVHSGLYGGNIYNPANILAQVIAQLKNDKHKVLIPGFYNSVRNLTKFELNKLAKFPFREKEVISETGSKTVVGEAEYPVQVRAGARPTLDVNGIWGGYTAEGPKTIIPSEATAKISMRLVPNQNSKKILGLFQKFVKRIMPKGVNFEIKVLSTGEPAVMNIESKYYRAAEKAYKKVFKKDPLYELSGGSIPITATLKSLLGIDSIMMGYGLPDDGLHSPNEKLSVSMFEKGIKTNREFLTSLDS